MDLLTRIKQDRVAAMKAKEAVRKSTLTTLLGDAETINKGPDGPITDDMLVKLVKKHITGLHEMSMHGKDEQRCTDEIIILSDYLPKQLDHEQIEAILSKAIKTGQVNNIGDAMKFMKTHYAGTYDGKDASRIAKGML